MAKVRKIEDLPIEVAAMVPVRILKGGDGKVSNGIHHATLGDEYYEKGETVSLPEDIALELEARGFVEIESA